MSIKTIIDKLSNGYEIEKIVLPPQSMPCYTSTNLEIGTTVEDLRLLVDLIRGRHCIKNVFLQSGFLLDLPRETSTELIKSIDSLPNVIKFKVGFNSCYSGRTKDEINWLYTLLKKGTKESYKRLHLL